MGRNRITAGRLPAEGAEGGRAKGQKTPEAGPGNWLGRTEPTVFGGRTRNREKTLSSVQTPKHPLATVRQTNRGRVDPRGGLQNPRERRGREHSVGSEIGKKEDRRQFRGEKPIPGKRNFGSLVWKSIEGSPPATN